MIRFIVAANVMSVLLVAPANAEVPINSKQVRVSDFHYPIAPGKWASYEVLAIVENLNTGGIVKPKASLLPSLTVPDKGVTFVDQNGNDYVPTNCATRPARTISIPVRMVSALPNEMQQVAVGAAFNGTNVEAFRTPWNTDPAGNPVTWPGIAGQWAIQSSINQVFQADKLEVEKQRAFRDNYKLYNVSLATLQELNFDLIVDNDVVATQAFSGSMLSGGAATLKIAMKNPDVYTCNRIANGGYSIIARYRFNDNATSQINARFDVTQTVSHFIKETQKATTKSKNSGWKILGIGSRRSKMKTSLESTLTSDTDIGRIENTQIVMSDANEEMIREFESVFFPELLKNEVITNHLAAANEADANKPALAEAHRKYAAALTNGSEDLETDAVGAAAALNEQDYATFIAKGVRFSNNSDSRTDNFRRTVKIDFSSTEQQNWSQARTVTRQRQTSSPVALATKQRFGPALGVYSGAQISYNSLQPIYGWESRTGLLVGGLHPAGALAAAGVMPGMILMRIDGQEVQSMADIGRALEYLEPGQTIPVEVLENTGGWVNPMTPVWGTNKYYTVTVGSYPLPTEERN